MLQQAQDLVSRMNNSDRIDFKNSWKLVTIFIGKILKKLNNFFAK
jgi:hypothetical protein